jgi:hypothetical protein
VAESTMYYAAAATIFATTDLDSLASSTTWVAGRESNVIDNTTNKYLDALLSGRFKANNTAPTAGQIQVWVGELLNDTEYPDVLDGTGSAETITSVGIRNASMKLAMAIDTDTTSNRIYEFSGVSVAALFGGVMPPKWFVFVAHSMVQTLNTTSTNGGQCWYKGIKVTP